MEIQNYDSLIKAISQISIDEPVMVIISGKDPQIFSFLSNYVENIIFKNKPVEINILTGENEDYSKFINDLYNFSLFIPNRLYILKQANIIFKNTKDFVFKEIPPRTWILIEYEGNPPLKLFKNIEKNLIHFPTKILYENQIDNFIKQYAKKYNLIFSDEAILEIKYLFPPKESSLRMVIQNLYQYFKHQSKQEAYFVTYESIRDVFYPSGGWDMFKIIDACFSKDLNTFLKEIDKYNPPEDNYFALLKNLLNKIDEFRKYLIAKQVNMEQKEILQLLGADKKHFVIQNKVLAQLDYSQRLYNIHQLKKMYDFIIDVSLSFRQSVDEPNRKAIFIKKAIEIFFS